MKGHGKHIKRFFFLYMGSQTLYSATVSRGNLKCVCQHVDRNNRILEPKLTLASSLEEDSDDKDLQTGHGDHHQTLNDGEIEDSLLSASHG
jgi:hypothetical protein